METNQELEKKFHCHILLETVFLVIYGIIIYGILLYDYPVKYY